ncbi:MAG: ATP-binding protein [Pseudomonadota bacterium]|mgnify:FL=1
MRSLFWSIFLSFWVALIVFSAATVVAVSYYLEQTREQEGARSPRERLALHAAEGQRIATANGAEGLKRWLRSVDRRELVPVLMIDRDGRDLLDRPVRPSILERMQRRVSRDGSSVWPRPEIVLPDGLTYRLIADYQSVTFARMVGRPRVLALPIVVATLVSGLVCFLLARYLSAPLVRLRRASEAYAAGNLNTRVMPQMGRRRDEIAELAQAFDRMAARLQELVTAQRQLLSDVSHELRSPLARLQVALGLARQRADGRATEELDRIEREAERLNDLIGQLLSLARLESGAGTATREPVDLAGLLADVAGDADFEARVNNRRVEYSSDTQAVIEGDGRLLQSAFENIVRNAVRHTIERSMVALTLARDPDRNEFWRISIRDRGPGVPDAMLARVFEPFVRVDDARDRGRGGYGLGLAIARRAILSHGGEVRASNDPDGGLRINVWLPVGALVV